MKGSRSRRFLRTHGWLVIRPVRLTLASAHLGLIDVFCIGPGMGGKRFRPMYGAFTASGKGLDQPNQTVTVGHCGGQGEMMECKWMPI